MNSHNDKKLDELLEKAAAVRTEPSPFIYTRISASLNAAREQFVSPWLAIAATLLLIALNVIIIRSGMQKQPEIGQVAKAMNLYNDNSLYQ
jgi:hypothetical protein